MKILKQISKGKEVNVLRVLFLKIYKQIKINNDTYFIVFIK